MSTDQKTPLELLEFTVNRTESNVPDLNGQYENLGLALRLVVAAGTILDQVKRVVFYRTEYNADKLNAAVAELMAIDEFDFTKDQLDAHSTPTAIENINTRIVHGVLGSVTEASELAEMLLKYMKEGKIDVINGVEETGDLLFYAHIVADSLGGSLEQAIEALHRKLKARYPSGFTTEAAVNRDVEQERSAIANE